MNTEVAQEWAKALRKLTRDLGHDPDDPEIKAAFRKALEDQAKG